MVLPKFEYLTAQTVEEASSLRAEPGAGAKLMAAAGSNAKSVFFIILSGSFSGFSDNRSKKGGNYSGNMYNKNIT